MRTNYQHGMAAVVYLAQAEGEARASAIGDIGAPKELVAAAFLIEMARSLICKAFRASDPGFELPRDAG